MGNSESYYQHFRSDILEILPQSAKNVLSVGCAAGVTEAELVKRGHFVVGVEVNPKAAQAAKERGIAVLEGDVETVDISRLCNSYDCLLYADVLEHLRDPGDILRKHVQFLREGGIVYISVPNFRHYSVFSHLFIKGNIPYQEAGIFDKTHIRMTTNAMVHQWCKEAGLCVTKYRYAIHGRRDQLISKCFFGLIAKFMGSQIVVVSIKS